MRFQTQCKLVHWKFSDYQKAAHLTNAIWWLIEALKSLDFCEMRKKCKCSGWDIKTGWIKQSFFFHLTLFLIWLFLSFYKCRSILFFANQTFAIRLCYHLRGRHKNHRLLPLLGTVCLSNEHVIHVFWSQFIRFAHMPNTKNVDARCDEKISIRRRFTFQSTKRNQTKK